MHGEVLRFSYYTEPVFSYGKKLIKSYIQSWQNLIYRTMEIKQIIKVTAKDVISDLQKRGKSFYFKNETVAMS